MKGYIINIPDKILSLYVGASSKQATIKNKRFVHSCGKTNGQ